MANRLLLLVLLSYLFVNFSDSVTFSSKLVHRFSEEAKELWSLRNGNVSGRLWPERNSLEYFQLLLRNDLKRRRMNVASQYEFLFPSEGSKTLFFGNDFDWLHYTGLI